MTDDRGMHGGAEEGRALPSAEIDAISSLRADAPHDEHDGAPARRMPALRGVVSFVEHVDGAFIEWAVFEVDARRIPGARAPCCLIFWREQCLRRVWDYPDDWRDLDDEELVALSWRR